MDLLRSVRPHPGDGRRTSAAAGSTGTTSAGRRSGPRRSSTGSCASPTSCRPCARRVEAADLRRRGLPRERVLACAVRLLEVGCFRVGGAVYAAENGSFGLSTLRKEHVRVEGDVIWFDYEAKSGKHQRHAVVDKKVLTIVSALKRRRAPADTELLAYKDGDRWVDVTAEDINGYLREHLGPGWSAKDFRTWVGTVLAAVDLAAAEPPESETARKRLARKVATNVAQHLGNTPAVARSAYIDPAGRGGVRRRQDHRPRLERHRHRDDRTSRAQVAQGVMTTRADRRPPLRRVRSCRPTR